jgi:hypothetical protein
MTESVDCDGCKELRGCFDGEEILLCRRCAKPKANCQHRGRSYCGCFPQPYPLVGDDHLEVGHA